MVLYSVHITVRHEAYEEYLEWLKTEHIQEVLACPGFVSADLCFRKGGNLEASSKEIRINYLIQNEDALKLYVKEYAMPLREKGLEKFPGQFSAQREVYLDSVSFKAK